MREWVYNYSKGMWWCFIFSTILYLSCPLLQHWAGKAEESFFNDFFALKKKDKTVSVMMWQQ